MKVSLNWLRYINDKYHCAAEPAPDGVDKLVERIGAQLGAVEEVVDLGKRYKGIVVVRVISVAKHPNADKLKVCLVDDAKTVKSVARDKNGLVEIVCGADNVEAGQTVAWIPPGATVPSTFDKDPFVIEKRDIRGIISNGMLASPKELALGDSHEGLLIIDEPAKPGQPFAKIAGLDDFIIDIENKMFTHRPDLFGHLGLAREIAGIQQHAFKSPVWYHQDAGVPADGRHNGMKLAIENQAPKLVPRFCAVVIKDIKVGPSPLWLQSFLIRVGVRPINNVVDITNLAMLNTAQPLHAYDYDKVKTGVLGVRLSKKGEQLKLLSGKEIKLDEGAVVITDGAKPIGLGGIMGGADTEVDKNTKNIILECANFDMNQTRKTAMAYGLFTDAATRFTKNQSPLQNMAVLARAIEDIKEIAGGRVASRVIDEKSGIKPQAKPVKTGADFINSRLGTNLTAANMKKILENVEFKVSVSGDGLAVDVPFWRTDVEIPEDIVEEVGRLYGYDKLPVILPGRDLSPAAQDKVLSFKSRLRNILATAGSNEVLTYSFINERLLRAAGQDLKEAFHIRNAVSPELQYYRLNILPSLLEKIHPNQKNGYDNFTLFEIGKGHIKGILDDEELPAEMETIAAVVVNPYGAGAPYFAARRLADYLFDELNIAERSYQPLDKAEVTHKTTWINCFEPNRTAVVWSADQPLGLIGEPSQKLRQALKLPAATSMFELDLSALYGRQQDLIYRPLNKFPSSIQDICLKISAAVSYQAIDRFLWDQLETQLQKQGYNYEMTTLDIFQRPQDMQYQQITWRIELSHPERTLTTEETNRLLDDLAKLAKKELNAERI